MAVRLLVMFSVIILELGLGVASILGVNSMYSRHQGIDHEGIAGIVMIVAGMVISWLMTIAYFVRKSSRAKALRLVDEAQMRAAKILGDATDKALALCSLDAPRCKKCGNPRTGKFCPQCGAAGEASAQG